MVKSIGAALMVAALTSDVEAPKEIYDEPLLEAYILEVEIPNVTVICISYTADVRRWGEKTAPGYCIPQLTDEILEIVERKHRERMKEIDPAAFGLEIG